MRFRVEGSYEGSALRRDLQGKGWGRTGRGEKPGRKTFQASSQLHADPTGSSEVYVMLWSYRDSRQETWVYTLLHLQCKDHTRGDANAQAPPAAPA